MQQKLKTCFSHETWTDSDTSQLHMLDAADDAWVDGPLTTEKFKERLPSLADVRMLIARGARVAIVGNGQTMNRENHGAEIDNHSVVVRFNNHIGEELDRVHTGTRTTIHVVNKDIMHPEPGTLQMDMESGKPWHSYCKRLHRGGEFSHLTGKLTLFRPSAYCALEGLDGFTRGFLFYWLVGSLFDHLDLYGMGHKDGRRHMSRTTGAHGAKSVAEPYLEFEHLVYEQARELVKRARRGP
eukprot:gnl/TRDRNA2_/TRDRNA2_166513_c1_seq1.p1 gnl/TRDRNA2_/TRDRNA2_166513_c1~~gnl/TRDRNA2_/TRDRNA2_166513_c1_seq1.p1  ORF type:complete len:240 (+),score=29.98 gnl/TRDRNA2_/TRDRNA2_166513_c1_seq1:212-931(+)